jgi:uncharacterized protein YhaN
MKIQSIHINGFGVWSDTTWGPLSPAINVFHGPNETGKSTLMAFIRSILFGFDRRGSPRRYEPFSGGAHGGRLDLEVAGRLLRVERKPGRHVRGTAVVYEGDSTSGEEALERLLAGTTRTLYHNVFAFGLEELEHFHTLQETEIASHISGAGLGIGAARWTAVQKDLEERQSELFLPRGQNTTINAAFKELEAIRDDLDRTARQPEEYLTAYETRARLATELEGLEQIVAELSKKVEHYAKRARARPLWERRTRIEARLREMPVVDHFPEGGIERLNLLTSRLRTLEAERTKNVRDSELRRLRRIELHSLVDPEERNRRAQVIETLRTLVPQVDAIGRVYSASLERHEAVFQEKAALENALNSMRPPSKPAFIIFVALLWFGVAGLAWAGHTYIAASIGAVSLAPMFWYRQRVARARGLQRRIHECSARLDACFAEVRRTEDEARHIEAEIRKLTGRVEVRQSDIEERVRDLEQLSKVAEEIRSLDEAAIRAEAEFERVNRQIEETRRQIQLLFGEASASGESEFVERAEIFKQRRQLIHELEKIPFETPEPGFLFDLWADEEAAHEAARADLAAAEARLAEVRHESGRIEERIVIMEKSEERSRTLTKQATVLARIDEAAEEWAIITLCRALLEEARKVYEVERQPEVLRQASSFFKVMTEGRYLRVIAPLDGTEFQVERADGVRLSPQLLSRGTAEQLYLAMRLALVREYARHVDPLPVVFDDIFVNFDPARARNSIAAVRDLATTHQILLFTCHPHLVRQVEEVVPDAAILTL